MSVGSPSSIVDRLFGSVMTMLDARVSRRRFLARSAVAASALVVDPRRYLLRPGSALGVVTCGDCRGSARCCDGWTTFCCSITGGSNACPSYSFMAGWWKCTEYQGSQLCASEGVRYYIDCNRTPGSSCPSGCHCAGDRCGNRSTCCNVFRYGQCNTDVPGVTEVVCRIVTCANPCELFGECNCTQFVENAVCGHESGCLGSDQEEELAWLGLTT